MLLLFFALAQLLSFVFRGFFSLEPDFFLQPIVCCKQSGQMLLSCNVTIVTVKISFFVFCGLFIEETPVPYIYIYDYIYNILTGCLCEGISCEQNRSGHVEPIYPIRQLPEAKTAHDTIISHPMSCPFLPSMSKTGSNDKTKIQAEQEGEPFLKTRDHCYDD